MFRFYFLMVKNTKYIKLQNNVFRFIYMYYLYIYFFTSFRLIEERMSFFDGGERTIIADVVGFERRQHSTSTKVKLKNK